VAVTRPAMDIDELVEHWTVLDEEQALVAGERGATRLAFACLLKFYTCHGRFPRGRSELVDEAEDTWSALLAEEDRRGLTPLFWGHVLPTAKSTST
jgi:hypothetical protein